MLKKIKKIEKYLFNNYMRKEYSFDKKEMYLEINKVVYERDLEGLDKNNYYILYIRFGRVVENDNNKSFDREIELYTPSLDNFQFILGAMFNLMLYIDTEKWFNCKVNLTDSEKELLDE